MPRSVVNSNVNVPIPERKWIDIDPQQLDRCCFEVSEIMTRTSQHDASTPYEENGAVRFDDLINKLKEEFGHKKSEEISHFSREVKDLIFEMGNNEIFEFYETSS